MNELYRIGIALGVLILGIPLGNLLAKMTKEELKKRRGLFKSLVLISGVGAIVSLILGNDVLLFGFLFIGIVTSRSLRKRNIAIKRPERHEV